MTEYRFSKAYLEITNRCNLSCSFCHGTRRTGAFLEPERFEVLARRLRPYAEYLYLHVLGEPLLHPDLGAILDIAAGLSFRICLTTNGTLLSECGDLLLSRAPSIYKISISLHAMEANGRRGDAVLSDCLAFAERAGKCGIICALRLWNLDGSASVPAENGENERILACLHAAFPGEWVPNRGGPKIGESVYLEYGEKFDWPDMVRPEYGGDVFCLGLRDQIGVLCDGTVVPCCLDAEGDIPLGNLFDSDLADILSSPRARALIDGFSRRAAVEPLCRRCGFARRFR